MSKILFDLKVILYFIIVRGRSGRRSGNPDLDLGNPDFPEFFFAFFASMDFLGPQGHPPDVPVPPNPDPDREIRFFKNSDFSFFYFLSLKTLQYGCLLTPLDQPKSPVPRYYFGT